MPKPINVLVVEDSNNDTLLLMREFQRNGYEPSHCRVETSGEMRMALHQHSWDLVVSDYTMPEFSGADALKLFSGSNLNVPFIFVSGTLGEEAAVSMMKAGANDYIVKGDLSRLVPTFEREKESLRLRRAQARAEAAMHHLAAIVESSEDAIYSVNLDGAILSWNPAAEKIYGYRADEVIGHSITALFPLSRRDELLETMSHLRRGELVGTYETERLRKDGRIIPVAMTTSSIKNAAGKVIGASAIARDISVQKQEEEDRITLISELTEALGKVNTLKGLLPICGNCNRILDEQGNWLRVENYIAKKSDATITHEVCPDCAKKV